MNHVNDSTLYPDDNKKEEEVTGVNKLFDEMVSLILFIGKKIQNRFKNAVDALRNREIFIQSAKVGSKTHLEIMEVYLGKDLQR